MTFFSPCSPPTPSKKVWCSHTARKGTRDTQYLLWVPTEGLLHKQHSGGFQAFVSNAVRPQVLALFSVALGLSAMDFTKDEGWDLRLGAKWSMVVFDHSQPTRKSTPICKSPWSKNITMLHRNTGNTQQEKGDSGPGPEAFTHIATKKTACKPQLHWHSAKREAGF